MPKSAPADAAAADTTPDVEATAAAISSTERHVKFLPLDDLRGDPRNPKSHSLETIDSSFDRFGMVDLITIDARTGYIISGHGRATVLKDLFAKGEKAPEGIKVTDDGNWLVPVNAGWASKNDAEAAAALIAMNRVTELGGWVDESLLALLEEISESGADFEGVGYGDDDFEALKMYVESTDMELNPAAVAAREAEWLESGGEDLEAEDLQAAHRLVVKFQTTEDFERFLKLIKVKAPGDIIRGGTWWPADVREAMRQIESAEELVISTNPRAEASADDSDDNGKAGAA